MHQMVLRPIEGFDIEHMDGCGLINLISNLRYATRSQNMHNGGKHKNNTSGYRGVKWCSYTNKWRAQIMIAYKLIDLGRHENKLDAVKAYNEASKKYCGEFGYQNLL